MPKKTPKAAYATARTLAGKLANEAPFTMSGNINDSDCIGTVAEALDATIDRVTSRLVAEIGQLSPDLARRMSDHIGSIMVNHQDAGYIFGLAVGQLVRVPALAPNGGGR